MSIIKNQANDFYDYKFNENEDYEDFIHLIRSQLYEYKKTPYKIEFLERIITLLKIDYDKHLEVCTAKVSGKCPKNKNYENSMFFIQEELEELEKEITPEEFSVSDKTLINKALKTILEDLDKVKLGQQITYDDFKDEFEELKDYYFLNKKTWKQLFAGKLAEMVAGGVISETLSKEIVCLIESNYAEIIGQ